MFYYKSIERHEMALNLTTDIVPIKESTGEKMLFTMPRL